VQQITPTRETATARNGRYSDEIPGPMGLDTFKSTLGRCRAGLVALDPANRAVDLKIQDDIKAAGRWWTLEPTLDKARPVDRPAGRLFPDHRVDGLVALPQRRSIVVRSLSRDDRHGAALHVAPIKSPWGLAVLIRATPRDEGPGGCLRRHGAGDEARPTVRDQRASCLPFGPRPRHDPSRAAYRGSPHETDCKACFCRGSSG
jgi:hypothetical protein